jgi:hypothetical protein
LAWQRSVPFGSIGTEGSCGYGRGRRRRQRWGAADVFNGWGAADVVSGWGPAGVISAVREHRPEEKTSAASQKREGGGAVLIPLDPA